MGEIFSKFTREKYFKALLQQRGRMCSLRNIAIESVTLKEEFGVEKYCHNPNDNTTQHNLNTVVELDMKMTVQTPPPPHHKNSTAASMSLRTTFIDDN